MESRAKFLGHPLHPMLIVIPAGLFLAAVVCDVFWLAGGDPIFAVVAFYNISGGLLGGAVAAAVGLRDFLAIPLGTRAKRIALTHGVANLAMLLLFAISWLVRRGAPLTLPPVFAMLFSFTGIALIAIAAWLGGELVDRLGVGVDPGANLNAPSSLSAKAPEIPRMASIPVTGQDEYSEQDEP